MQIHVADSFFGLLEVRFVTILLNCYQEGSSSSNSSSSSQEIKHRKPSANFGGDLGMLGAHFRTVLARFSQMFENNENSKVTRGL